MRCPGCGHDNASSVRFCAGCGIVLVETRGGRRRRSKRSAAATPGERPAVRKEGARRFGLAFAAVMGLAVIGGLAVSWSSTRTGVVIGTANLAPLPAGPVAVPPGSNLEHTSATIGDPLPSPRPGSERIVPPREPVRADTARSREASRPASRDSAPSPATLPEPVAAPETVALAAPPVVAPATAPRNDLDSMLAGCARTEGLDRFFCDQKARLRWCDGRWGQTSECPSGRTADYGQ